MIPGLERGFEEPPQFASRRCILPQPAEAEATRGALGIWLD
jgi:hypothetical protein